MKIIIEPHGHILLPVVKLMHRDSLFECECLFLHVDDGPTGADAQEDIPCMILKTSSSVARGDLPCLMKSPPLSVLRELHDTDSRGTIPMARALDLYFGCARGDYLTSALHYESPEMRQEAVTRADAFFATAIDMVVNDLGHVVDDKCANDCAVRAIRNLQTHTLGLGLPQYAYMSGVIESALERAMERACLVRRRHACAARIQKSFLTAIYDPSHAMCRQRLLRDFEDITHLLHAS